MVQKAHGCAGKRGGHLGKRIRACVDGGDNGQGLLLTNAAAVNLLLSPSFLWKEYNVECEVECEVECGVECGAIPFAPPDGLRQMVQPDRTTEWSVCHEKVSP